MNRFARFLRCLPLLLSLAAAGASASLGFLDEPRLEGDLDGDGRNELVLLLWNDPGGSGTFVYLNVIRLDEEDNPRALFALVGDRVQIMDARIENGTLLLEVIQPGEGESSCCGSQKVLRHWKLEGDRLVELPMEIEGRVSVEDLEGRRWRLKSLDDDPVGTGAQVTLEVKDGQVLGNAGCNRYFAEVNDVREQGRAIRIGPVGSTRKACAAPIMDLERRYLEALRHVTSFSIEGRQLVLSWNREGRYGSLHYREMPAERNGSPGNRQ